MIRLHFEKASPKWNSARSPSFICRVNMLRVFVLVCIISGGLGSPLAEEDRIAGGEIVDISSVKYQLSFENNGTHKCGATIISKDWAVTTVPCSEGTMQLFTVRAGSSVLGEGGSVHNVVHIITNPSYNRATHDYDLAILLISPPFSFGSNVGAVTLPLQGDEFQAGVDAIASGWGATETGSSSSTVKLVRLPLTSAANCTASYSGRNDITDRMVCAGVPIGGLGSCQGDNGGPLVTQNRLVGIYSFSNGCATPQYPSVYSKLSSMRNWITQNTGV